MSARKIAAPPAEKITIEDIKHRAEEIKDLAVIEAKETASVIVGTDAVKTLVIVAGLVVVAASFAFFLGSRARRGSLDEI